MLHTRPSLNSSRLPAVRTSRINAVSRLASPPAAADSVRRRSSGLVPVPPHVDHVHTLGFKVASNLIHALEKAVVAASGGRDTSPRALRYLKGNFAPVSDEILSQKLEVVEGALPAALDGAFLRIGPNPQLPPTGGYHWFDGDGMVHCVRVKNGQASYSNSFVETARLRQERAAGFPQFIKLGDSKGVPGIIHSLLKVLKEKWGVNRPEQDGDGTGNTAMVFHGGRLLALHEGDRPYALRVNSEGVVESLGRVLTELKHDVTAHPKVDPETGELFYFGYAGRPPYCFNGLVDAEGNLVHDYPMPLPGAVMMHDFALTKDYVIIYDHSLGIDGEVMVKEGGFPVIFDKSKRTRFGVLPRYAKDASETRWFETDPLVTFHTANAWQEGNKIKVFLCTFEEFDIDMSDFNAKTLPYLTEVTLDLGPGGGASVRRVAEVGGDFPRVPASVVGRKTRYTYLATMATGVDVPSFWGVAKIDLQASEPAHAVAGIIEYGGQRFGGEVQFVPSGGPEEDDGYLVTFVHDEASGRTDLVILDAKTMDSKPLARVRMPRRVPYGFHGLWVSSEELASQA